MTPASKPQQKNFAKFMEWQLKDESVSVVTEVIRLANLSSSEIGARWGVTVFPSQKTAVALNVGKRYLAEVQNNGDFVLYLVGSSADLEGLVADLSTKRAYPSSLENAFSVKVPLNQAGRLLSIPQAQAQFRELVEISYGGRLNPSYHNPLVTRELGLSDQQRDRSFAVRIVWVDDDGEHLTAGLNLRSDHAGDQVPDNPIQVRVSGRLDDAGDQILLEQAVSVIESWCTTRGVEVDNHRSELDRVLHRRIPVASA